MKDLKHIMDVAFEQVTELGGVIITGIIALFLLFFNLNVGFKLILAIIVVTIISYVIKIVFFKHRPKKQSTETFLKRVDASSFPSVHSARIATLAFWIILYINNIYMSIFTAIIGLIVAYSRIYLKKHYWSDVIGGIIIAIIVNSIIYLTIRVSI